MKLHLLKVERSRSGGGILNGLHISFMRGNEGTNDALVPLCLLNRVYFENRSFSSLGLRVSLTQRRSAMT